MPARASEVKANVGVARTDQRHLADEEERSGPRLVRLPVAGRFRAHPDRETAYKVVIGKGLQKRRVDIGAIVGAARGPDLVEEDAHRPWAWLCQCDDRGADPEFLGVKRVARRCRQQKNRAGAPDNATGFHGREERGRDDVAEAVDPGVT
jgi:hypothetical protein